MKQTLMNKTGALREGFNIDEEFGAPNSYGVAESDFEFTQRPSSYFKYEEKLHRSSSVVHESKIFESFFWYVVPEGDKVLVSYSDGRSEVVTGPKKIFKFKKTVVPLKLYSAFPGEFLVVKFRDGRQKHLKGPAQQWFNPNIHSKIELQDALIISENELVVVYSKESASGKSRRRIVRGPTTFVPQPDEWLHTFSWHGSKGKGYKKYPNALVFQKLTTMPDQMYYDVENVRTSDEITLTIRLMLFFQLKDIEKMLESTNDPIGDFINSITSDVIEFVGKYTFDEFKTHQRELNSLDSYPTLLQRSQQIGYSVDKLVFLGYQTSGSVASMYSEASQRRLKLKLKHEEFIKEQELADLKQERDSKRAEARRKQEREELLFKLENQQIENQAEIERIQAYSQSQREEREKDAALSREIREKELEQNIDYFRKLKELGVDLTAFLTQGRADQIIELRTPKDPSGGTVSPHLHLGNKPDKSE